MKDRVLGVFNSGWEMSSSVVALAAFVYGSIEWLRGAPAEQLGSALAVVLSALVICLVFLHSARAAWEQLASLESARPQLELVFEPENPRYHIRDDNRLSGRLEVGIWNKGSLRDEHVSLRVIRAEPQPSDSPLEGYTFEACSDVPIAPTPAPVNFVHVLRYSRMKPEGWAFFPQGVSAAPTYVKVPTLELDLALEAQYRTEPLRLRITYRPDDHPLIEKLPFSWPSLALTERSEAPAAPPQTSGDEGKQA